MEESTADVFANRNEPLRRLAISDDDSDDTSSEADDDEETASRKTPRSTAGKGSGHVASPSKPSARQSLQDRMFEKLFAQVIPSEDLKKPEDIGDDRHGAEHAQRPGFSLSIMGNNFRRFNARIGIVFVFQNQVAQLFGWKTPTHTLSFLAVYTFVCLDPYLLLALPLAVALLFIMIPAFTSRHPPPPPPPVVSLSTREHSLSAHNYSGPALAPARTIKPAPETSKDFFRNMRDLQNSMSDFSDVHDLLVSTIAPATNFSNEVLSSTIFLLLTVLTATLFISAHLIPFRLISLLGGHALIISSHPRVQRILQKQKKKADKRALQSPKSSDPHAQSGITIAGIVVNLPDNSATRTLQSTLSSMSQITLSMTPEFREVEVFELQHRAILPATSSSSVFLSSSSTSPEAYEWSSHLYTPSPYDPLSPSRIAGERPKGTRFFEDVQPPAGWQWASKKWVLDLEVGEWVNERLIVGVEYDSIRDNVSDVYDDNDHRDGSDVGSYEGGPSLHIADGETHGGKNDGSDTSFIARRKRKQSVNLDFGGWVWDLPPAVGTSGNRDEDVWLAYGDYDIPSLSREQDQRRKELEKAKAKATAKGHKKNSSSIGSNKSGGAAPSSKQTAEKDWEEGVRTGNTERTGEWRRRRWVRVVQRKSISG